MADSPPPPSLSVTPGYAMVLQGASVSITPTLAGSSAALTASASVGTLSTTTPASGGTFTFTAPASGTGTARITIREATDGLLQTVAVSFYPSGLAFPFTRYNSTLINLKAEQLYYTFWRYNAGRYARFDTQTFEDFNAVDWPNFALPAIGIPPGPDAFCDIPNWLAKLPIPFVMSTWVLPQIGATPAPTDHRKRMRITPLAESGSQLLLSLTDCQENATTAAFVVPRPGLTFTFSLISSTPPDGSPTARTPIIVTSDNNGLVQVMLRRNAVYARFGPSGVNDIITTGTNPTTQLPPLQSTF